VVLHDIVGFGALILATLVLFSATLYFFHSFEQFRANLATDWSRRGGGDLRDKKPSEAVVAFRTAINFDQDGSKMQEDEEQLAQALAEDGHFEEATNYLLALWDAKPADGLINLQLARISRAKNDPVGAANYYRAAIDGSWPGDGAAKRNAVRMELADFLLQNKQPNEARNLLFVVAGNSPDDATVNMTVAGRLEGAGFVSDALNFYRKAADAEPTARLPLALAGRAAFELGHFAEAERLLNEALANQPDPQAEAKYANLDVTQLAEQAHRIRMLNLNYNQPAMERADHIALAASIAQNRLETCLAKASTPTLLNLQSEWTAAQPKTLMKRRMLEQNAVMQDFWTQLIYTTEQQTVADCGKPTGDDALLLLLADIAQAGQPETSQRTPLVVGSEPAQEVEVLHGN